MRRFLRWLLAILLTLGLLGYVVFQFWPLHNPHPAPRVGRGVLAIAHAKVYPSPDAEPVENATVVVRDGKIAAWGPEVAVPEGARVLACDHCVVMAGFWNAHVHFTEPKWNQAAWQSAEALNAQLEDMTTGRGFTTVVDLGSDPRSTISLRRRIETGDLKGPTIYTAGQGLFPPDGIPFYIKRNTPSFITRFIPQPANPKEAEEAARHAFAQGADVLKLFTGSYVTPDHVLPMPEDIAAAAVSVAHEERHLVFSHPSDLAGTLVAVHSGVDLLAHAPDTVDGIDDQVLRTIVDRHTAMIPTLKMFATTVTKKDSYLKPIYGVVRRFRELGGELVFGTDVGYMTDYATDDEFLALRESGVDAMGMLRMLTTAPAQRFGVLDQRGTIAPGKMADLVVLHGDPAQDVTAFARVDVTIRNGDVVYQRAPAR